MFSEHPYVHRYHDRVVRTQPHHSHFDRWGLIVSIRPGCMIDPHHLFRRIIFLSVCPHSITDPSDPSFTVHRCSRLHQCSSVHPFMDMHIIHDVMCAHRYHLDSIEPSQLIRMPLSIPSAEVTWNRSPQLRPTLRHYAGGSTGTTTVQP